ncbi:hypothetical protein FBU30_003749 [Linnemannia zychae]|nr:hypothetical protein FBU30_003749 [Linnemannia zychae]
MPPKKSSSPAKTISAADFFTRGKKPTTTNRVATAKKSAAPLLKTVVSSNNTKLGPQQKEKFQGEQEQKKLQNISFHANDGKNNQSEDDNTNRLAHNTGLLDEALLADVVELQKPSTQSIAKPDATPAKIVVKSLSQSSTTKRSYSKIKSDNSVDIKNGIHQNEFSDQEKSLHQFDLASKYGPCTDMTRLERWERAFGLGLSPPLYVKDLLIKNPSLNIPIFARQI